MFKLLKFLLVLSSASTIALGHGVITKPTPRTVGPATRAACGAGAYGVLSSDLTAPIENVAAKADSGYNPVACPIAFCRGLSFDDNKQNVQTFTPGQQIPFLINIRVRHNGFANVSVVDVASKKVIGSPLFNWPLYTSTAIPPAQYPKNETDFNVTLPDLGTKCLTAGECAIQWWWLGSNAQTYISCVDFKIATA